MAIIRETAWDNVHVWKRSELAPFPLHFHSYVEVLYITKGRSVVTVDFDEYILEPGDMLVIFPDRIHSVIMSDEGTENYVIFFPKEISVFDTVFDSRLPPCPVLHSADRSITDLFDSAHVASRTKGKKYAKGETLGYILILLAKLLPMLNLKAVKYDGENIERKIIEYCTEHFSEQIKLTDVASEFGYTPSYFSDIFSEKIKGGFSKFINTLRVEEAKKLLLGETGMSDIAYSCGFGSIRTFNRVFKEQTGKTPREYRGKTK